MHAMQMSGRHSMPDRGWAEAEAEELRVGDDLVLAPREHPSPARLFT
jgi:hypothetical protein